MKNLFSKIRNNRGLSLIEITVTISILLILFIMIENFIRTGFLATKFGNEQAEAVTNARRALSQISVDIREANQSERGDYALTTIDEQDFVWYGDINNDGKTERIKYYVDGPDMIRVVTLPGASDNYDFSGGTTTIATYLNNLADPVFRYFDAELNETDVINDVRLIRVLVKVNVTPTIMPNDYELETDIHLRNLKDNL